ncbi:hypothetical protein [Pseudorhizobium flavum]|uniref:hypothetical protein n=1 Tax=Pseudorhizobium flavum TaxID=1335061 RepID=UPI0024936AAE|nr:hypothetical protein [Pseudorhizobium flavum]
MNHLAPGGVSAGFGLVVGLAAGALAVTIYKVAEMKFAGGGFDFLMKVETIAQDAKEARKLAQLSVEMIMSIANRPTGVLGGGFIGRNDGLRKLIAERLTEMGFSKEEASHFARFDEPHVGRRIIQQIILRAVKDSVEGGQERAQALVQPFLGPNGQRAPDFIESTIGPELLQVGQIRSAVSFYRSWYESNTKLHFFVENAERLKDSASATEGGGI